MATNDFDSEAMLAFFQQLGREVDNLKTKIASLNEQSGGGGGGGKGFGQAADNAEKFGKQIEKDTKAMTGLAAASAGLLRIMGGAGGLVATAYSLGKAMDNFAVGELRMRNFANNVGLSQDVTNKLSISLQRSGE